MIKIETQQQLDELLLGLHDGELLECFVALAGGLMRSSKDISFENDKHDYYVYNEVDDSEEVVKHADFNNSTIGEALSKGALYKY